MLTFVLLLEVDTTYTCFASLGEVISVVEALPLTLYLSPLFDNRAFN